VVEDPLVLLEAPSCRRRWLAKGTAWRARRPRRRWGRNRSWCLVELQVGWMEDEPRVQRGLFRLRHPCHSVTCVTTGLEGCGSARHLVCNANHGCSQVRAWYGSLHTCWRSSTARSQRPGTKCSGRHNVTEAARDLFRVPLKSRGARFVAYRLRYARECMGVECVDSADRVTRFIVATYPALGHFRICLSPHHGCSSL
jgi:hypothetical protein